MSKPVVCLINGSFQSILVKEFYLHEGFKGLVIESYNITKISNMQMKYSDLKDQIREIGVSEKGGHRLNSQRLGARW